MPRPILHPRFIPSLLTLFLTGGIPASVFADDGTWNTASSGNWSDPTRWTGAIADGAGFTATFSAPTPNTSSPAVTITLDSDRTIGNLTFTGSAATGTHNFMLSGPGVLTLAGDSPTITAGLSARAATITATLAGSQGVTFASLSNSGLVIGGANTYTGLTQVADGTVVTVAHNQAFGSTNGATTLNGMSGIQLNAGVVIAGEVLNARGNGNSSNHGAIHTAANASAAWNGDINLLNNARFGANGAAAVLTLGGVISGNYGASFSFGGNSDANGTVVLSGASTYTGTTTVFRGTLKLDAGNNRLPTGTTLIIGGTANAATFDLNGYDQTVATLRSGAGAGARTLTNTSGTTSTLTVNQAAGTEVFDGIVSGKIDFVKSGAGTLNLANAASTFSGDITVNAGTLGLASAFIDDSASVSLLTGALLSLNYAGTDSIGALYIDGVLQAAGTWGALGSGAQFETALIAGSGLLSFAAIPEPSSAVALLGAASLFAAALRRRRA